MPIPRQAGKGDTCCCVRGEERSSNARGADLGGVADMMLRLVSVPAELSGDRGISWGVIEGLAIALALLEPGELADALEFRVVFKEGGDVKETRSVVTCKHWKLNPYRSTVVVLFPAITADITLAATGSTPKYST